MDTASTTYLCLVSDRPDLMLWHYLEAEAKDGIVDELLSQGPTIFSEVAKSQWGSYCIQHSQRRSFSLARVA
jgi:hypothetical protein